MRFSADKLLGTSPIPTMPDGSVALLPVEQDVANPHQLSEHGWPPNNIQEYINAENAQISEMFIKNLEIQKRLLTPDSQLNDAQKAALCGSRYARTADEFVQESLRIDRVRQSFEADDVDKELSPSVEPTKKDEEIIDKV